MSRLTIGTERYAVEHIESAKVVALAKKSGWNAEEGEGFEGLREYCEPNEAATWTTHKTFDEAKVAALAALAAGDSFYGAAIIENQVVEEACDDRGNIIRACPPEWRTQAIWEVTSDGDVTQVRE